MFVVIDKEEKKHYAFDESKEVLKKCSNNSELCFPHFRVMMPLIKHDLAFK